MLARASTLASVVGSLGILAATAACGSSSNSNKDGGGDDDDATHIDAPRPDADLMGITAVPLTSDFSLSYSAPVTIGGQTFSLSIDTGSSTLGVASTLCANCGVSPEYDVTTGADQHHTASSQYADGTGWDGEIYNDMLSVGTGPSVPANIVAITNSNQFFRGQDGQGIIGLGGTGNLLPNTSSYVHIAAVSQHLFANSIGVQLCKDDGTLWLGGYDSDAGKGTPVMTPLVDGVQFYETDETGASVGSAALTGINFGDTIFDTGSSLSYIPSAAQSKILAAVNADAGYKSVFTQSLSANGCVSATGATASVIDAALPRLGVTFSGASHQITLPASKSYLIEQSPGQWCFAFGNAAQVGLPGSLFGDSFLNGVVVEFELGLQQVVFDETKCPEGNARAPQHTADGQQVAPIQPSPDRPWWMDVPRLNVPHFDAKTGTLTHARNR